MKAHLVSREEKEVALIKTAYVGSTVAELFTSALDIALVIGGISLGGIIAEAMDRVYSRNDG